MKKVIIVLGLVIAAGCGPSAYDIAMENYFQYLHNYNQRFVPLYKQAKLGDVNATQALLDLEPLLPPPQPPQQPIISRNDYLMYRVSEILNESEMRRQRMSRDSYDLWMQGQMLSAQERQAQALQNISNQRMLYGH
jgi:hypothetical protein